MIKLNHADKYYNRGSSNELHVMNDICLELPESGMIAVFGRSGCGKTTLLNAIGGLDKLSGGEITVFGNDISKDTDRLRNKYIGYIFQNYNLSLTETVFENVADALRLCGLEDAEEIKKRVLAALSNVGMEKYKNRTPDTLSGGQQQRVAIARAIVKNPAIILADEPTGNLDEANTVMIMDILKEISRDHLVVLVTHEANLVDYYCDRVIEIVDGKVNSVRDNENANGYTCRNKNDIFLGELEKSEESVPGVSIEYYGEKRTELKLRIVSVDGKLYLKSDSPELKILDESSEIKLREGTFSQPEQKKALAERIDMSCLKAVEGKKTGRLFSFKSALLSGYRQTFARNNKKGRKLLRASMFLLAFVVVFMSSDFAVGLKSLSDIRLDHNDTEFFIPLTSETDTSSVYDHIGENGIDYARVISGDYTQAKEYISFCAGNFMTASVSNVTAQGCVLDAVLAEGLDTVCGTKEFEKPFDVIITTALADEMISGCGASFISSYSDLLNMVSSRAYAGGNYLRITGVVESAEKNFYLESIYATYIIMENAYGGMLNVFPTLFEDAYAGKVEQGKVVLRSESPSVSAGDTAMIMGKNYIVSAVERLYAGVELYSDFVYAEKGIKLLGENEYCENRLATEPGADPFRLSAEWFFDYYMQYFAEFCKKVIYLDIHPWIYSMYGNIECLIASSTYMSEVNIDELTLYRMYKYKQANGVYPSNKQLESVPELEIANMERQYYVNNDEAVRVYENSYYNSNYKYGGDSFIMNDKDYTSLAYTTGKNDFNVCSYDIFQSGQSFTGQNYYSHYMLIHTSDAEQARQYLEGFYSETLITPDDVFETEIGNSRVKIIADTVSLAVVLILICLCVFFIMRSTLMSRVKEVGVYRAIGVSKRNLSFCYMIESLVLTTLSLTIGYIIASAFVMKLSSFSVFEDSFFFPVWFALLILAGLYAATVLCGTLPVLILMRKTPSEILAKYDI